MTELSFIIHDLIAVPAFHLLYLCLGLILVFILFALKHKYLFSSDLPPQIYQSQPLKRSELAALVPVKTGIFIQNFSQFDMVLNQFTMDAIVWFEFNSRLISFDIISKFKFENASKFSKSEPEVRREGNQIFVKYNVQVTFSTRLDQRFFPFSNHMLYIILDNEALIGTEAIFQTQESSFCWTPKLNTPSWRITGKKTESGFEKFEFKVGDSHEKLQHPRIVYSLELERSGMRLTALIFIPIFLVVNFGVFALGLPDNMRSSVLSLCIGSITGLLSYRYVIERIAPPVGYFTLTDKIYNFILLCGFATFLIAALRLTEEESSHTFHMLNDYWFLVLPVMFIGVVYYYLFWWAHQKVLTKEKIKKSKALVITSDYIKQLNHITLSSLKKYSSRHLEFPEPDNKNWLNPDYTNVYERYGKRFLWRQSYLPWSPALFIDLLLDVTHERPNRGDFLIKIIPKSNAHLFIFGDLHGSFHSLTRDLEKLKSLGHLDDHFKLTSLDDFIVFNGNVIDRSPYVLETLSLVLLLMKRNGEQVIYNRGSHESAKEWKNYQLLQEAKYKINTDMEVLQELFKEFFKKLSTRLYIKDPTEAKYLRISHRGMGLLNLLNEKNITEFLEAQNESISYLSLDPTHFSQGKEESIRVEAIILSEEHTEPQEMPSAFELMLPHNGITVWRIFSAPNLSYLKLNNFSQDAFLDLNTSGKMDSWIGRLYRGNAIKPAEFSMTQYSVVYGMKITPENLHIDYSREVVVATSVDLSNFASGIGVRVANGLQAAIVQKNEKGGILRMPIRYVCLDNEYTTQKTLKNIEVLEKDYHAQFILSAVGTTPVESFIPLVREKKLSLLFPITGANIVRDPTLEYIINFRPSYFEEGKEIIRYAIEKLLITRIAIFYQNDNFGMSLLEGAESVLKLHPNVEYVKASYERFSTNIDEAAAQIQTFNPIGILFFSTQFRSRRLIEKLGVANLADKVLMGVSFLTDDFANYLKEYGLQLTITRVVPNLNEDLSIIHDFKAAMDILGEPYSYDAFEAYLDVRVFFSVAESIEPPITVDKIIQKITSLKQFNLGGIILNFDPQNRQLAKDIWIERLT